MLGHMLCLLLISSTMVKSTAPPSFKVSKPMTLASHQNMKDWNVGWPDASLYAVRKANGEYIFVMDWQTMSSKGGELKASKLIANSKVQGYPCPEGYPEPCLRHKQENQSTVNMWTSNLYHIGGDELLAFIHMEFRKWGDKSANHHTYFRHGLSYSNDSGKTFSWCGYVSEPALSFGNTTQGHEKYGRPKWTPNMGLSNYIIKDGYFQIYYGDTNALDDNGHVVNTSEALPGHAGNPDQGVAAVRASVANVVAAARQLKAVPWFKYYNGTWEEPALGDGLGGFGGGRFTPLLPSQGYMHGDAIYVAPIKQYAIVAHSGGKVQDTKDWRKTILIAFSPDGRNWSKWQKVYTNGVAGDAYYPSLMSYGPDNEVAGITFAVAYLYRAGNVSQSPFQYNMVNVTMLSNSTKW